MVTYIRAAAVAIMYMALCVQVVGHYQYWPLGVLVFVGLVIILKEDKP